MKNILLLIMLCTSIFVACSDDDDKDDGNGNEKGWVVTMNRIINDKFEEDKDAYLICAGSGKMEIDWGDGTISKDLELPLYEEYDENFDADEDLDGSEFEHTYAQKGSYTITIKGEGKLTYLDLDCDTIKSLDVCAILMGVVIFTVCISNFSTKALFIILEKLSNSCCLI